MRVIAEVEITWEGPPDMAVVERCIADAVEGYVDSASVIGVTAEPS